jgi:hypothetical protein
MKPKYAAGLVRRWVGLYTRGLPAPIRQDRRDEIDSDLWSQAHDAAVSGHSERSVAVDILVRLLLGVPADLSWRVERQRLADAAGPQTGVTVSVRPVALLAVIGGAGWTIWPIPAVIVGATWPPGDPLTWLLVICVVLGSLALAFATMGLILSVQDRIRPASAVVGALGASIGALSFMGAYVGVIGLLLGSAIVAWELGRLGALSSRLSKTHVVAAVLSSIMLIAIMANPASLYSVMAIGLLASILLYGVSWIAIGWSIRHGVTIPERTATSG